MKKPKGHKFDKKLHADWNLLGQGTPTETLKKNMVVGDRWTVKWNEELQINEYEEIEADGDKWNISSNEKGDLDYLGTDKHKDIGNQGDESPTDNIQKKDNPVRFSVNISENMNMKYKDFFVNEMYEGKHIVTLTDNDVLTYKDSHLFVNGKPFQTTSPDESQDWIRGVENNKLITKFKGRSSLINAWEPNEITGFYLLQENIASTVPHGFDHVEVAAGIELESAEHPHDDKTIMDTVLTHLKIHPKYYSKIKGLGLADAVVDSSSNLGNPESPINTREKMGNSISCGPGNNIVGGIGKKPEDVSKQSNSVGTPTSTGEPKFDTNNNYTVDIDVGEPVLPEQKLTELKTAIVEWLREETMNTPLNAKKENQN